MNISIWSPDYAHSCGGVRVLHYIGFLSHRLGHKVTMECNGLNNEWGNYSKKNDKYDFRIIPEILPITKKSDGNIVRFVLFFPGRLGNGPKKYPEHEYVISYDSNYTESIIEATNGKYVPEFYLPYSDMLGCDKNREKTIPGLIWYGKAPIISNPDIANFSVINRFWPTPRSNLIHFLNCTKTLYSYDQHTSLNDEALLCGCDVLLWDGDKFEKYENDYPEKNVMNIDRDMMNVNNFIVSIQKHFGI